MAQNADFIQAKRFEEEKTANHRSIIWFYRHRTAANIKFQFVALFEIPIVGAGHDLPFGNWNNFRFSKDNYIIIACGDVIL